MTADGKSSGNRRSSWIPWCILLGYSGLRLASLPADTAVLGGFCHDSAYLAKVADNLQAGQGYSNDALWLVFLQPPALPMPYHNANPLYPTLIAAVSWLTGKSVIYCGFLLSAVASSMVLAALVVLIGRYGPSAGAQTFLACAGALFSSTFTESLQYTPDALCLAFVVACVACVARTTGVWWAVAGGVLFGLAWLTRSSAILVLPAIAVYLLLAHGWRRAVARLAVLGGTAFLIALPWLVHTARVWGNPLRSDASYYLWQEYHARAFGGSVPRYWHSTQVPASLGELLKREPGAVAGFVLRCFPLQLRYLVAGWSYGNYAVATLLVVLTLFAGWRLLLLLHAQPEVRRAYRPELAAAGVYGMSAFLGLAPRAPSLEIRYFAPLTMLLSLLLAWGALEALRGLRLGSLRQRLVALTAAVLSAVLWLGLVPYRDAKEYRRSITPDAERVRYWKRAREVNEQYGKGAATVVGDFPYAYTLATGAPALSIPESDDAGLLDYMKRYHASYVFLTREERQFWRPCWQQPGGLPPRVALIADLGDAYVYQQKDQQ